MMNTKQLVVMYRVGVCGLLYGFSIIGSSAAIAADVKTIDWSKVTSSEARLFYPGQSSYEWLRTEDHKKASKEVTDGEACLKCHKGEQKSLGGILVVGNRLEDAPIAKKDGYQRLSVQAAHDNTNLYMRFSWKSAVKKPGDHGNYMRFDGSKWEWFGGHRQSSDVAGGKEPALYPDRLGIMFGDSNVAMYPDQGCWVTCHDSMTGMAEDAAGKKVAEHPILSAIYKQFGIKNDQVRKYLPGSRTKGTDWAAVKTPAQLTDERKKGAFLDLIIWDAALTNPGDFAADFNVLEIKTVDAGVSPLYPNGKMLGGPGFMFDKAKVGFSVLSEADLNNPAKAKHLVVGKTTVPAAGGFKKGDILPAHIVDTSSAKGSAADVYAKGEWKDGTYTVVIKRKLDTGNPLDDKVLKIGSVYSFGFSIHDDAAGKRAHHVSFPISVSIGPGKADIQAETLK